ncbi:hypothetical protein E4U25_004254 [Claviceps purpurea]|nr:hypothetical protein E4U26_002688 [Claviceps purpurea]KAG6242331.1 hypothetical protein E4U25_004254 [Claviceps purpurea]
MGKERQALPILDRENHQDWLRRVKIAIESKDVTIALQFTKHEYAWIEREGGAVNTTPTASAGAESAGAASAATASDDPEMDDLTNRFERLGGSWNIERKKEWTHANAKCLTIMVDGLSSARILACSLDDSWKGQSATKCFGEPQQKQLSDFPSSELSLFLLAR